MARLRQIAPRFGTVAPLLGRAEVKRVKDQPGAEWYRTARWQKVVARIRRRDGMTCRQTGVPLLGSANRGDPDSPVVDHIIPHRGDPALFWDESNLQLVSKAWHDSTKQARDRRGQP